MLASAFVKKRIQDSNDVVMRRMRFLKKKMAEATAWKEWNEAATELVNVTASHTACVPAPAQLQQPLLTGAPKFLLRSHPLDSRGGPPAACSALNWGGNAYGTPVALRRVGSHPRDGLRLSGQAHRWARPCSFPCPIDVCDFHQHMHCTTQVHWA